MEENNRSESQITNPANTNVQIVSVQGNPGEGFGIASLITALLGLSIIPVILGFIGLSKSKKISQKNGPALAGVIIGFISFFIKIVIILGIIAISYSSYELMKKDVFISRPDIELPTVRQEKDQLICDETNYDDLQLLGSDSNYKVYIETKLTKDEYGYKYEDDKADILVCSGDTNKMIKEIVHEGITPISAVIHSNLDYILLDSGTGSVRQRYILRLEHGDMLPYILTNGEVLYWNHYYIYTYKEAMGSKALRAGLGDNNTVSSIHSVNAKTGEDKLLITNKDLNIDSFVELINGDILTYKIYYYDSKAMAYDVSKTQTLTLDLNTVLESQE